MEWVADSRPLYDRIDLFSLCLVVYLLHSPLFIQQHDGRIGRHVKPLSAYRRLRLAVDCPDLHPQSPLFQSLCRGFPYRHGVLARRTPGNVKLHQPDYIAHQTPVPKLLGQLRDESVARVTAALLWMQQRNDWSGGGGF